MELPDAEADLVLLILLTERFHLLPQCTHLVAILHRLVPDLPGLGSIPARLYQLKTGVSRQVYNIINHSCNSSGQLCT